MSRRTLAILLVSLAVTAIGAVWLASGIGSAPEWAGESPKMVAPSREVDASPTQLTTEPAAFTSEDSPEALTIDLTSASGVRESAVASPSDSELERAIWVGGRVSFPPGIPGDEQVVIVADGRSFESLPLHRARVAPDGTFRVAFAQDTILGELRLEARYLYLENRLTVRFRKPVREFLLEPKLGGCIRGRIMLPSEAESFRKFLVGRVKASGAGWVRNRSGVVDENLEFEIRGVPAESTCSVSLVAPGFAKASQSGLRVEVAKTLSVDLALELSVSASGMVRDPSGEPASRARVIATDLGTRREELEAITTPSGRFEIAGLHAGRWELSAKAPGFVPSEKLSIDLGSTEPASGLELALRPAGRIAGRVIRWDGQPAARVALILSKVSPSLARSEVHVGWEIGGTADRDGTFEFKTVDAGRYRIEVGSASTVEHGNAALSDIQLEQSGSVEGLELRTEPPCRVEGQVTGVSGESVAGVAVFVLYEGDVRAWERHYAATTDKSGRFVIDGLAPGPVELQAQCVDPLSARGVYLELRAGETTEADLELQAATWLHVQLDGFGVNSGIGISVVDEHGHQVERSVAFGVDEMTSDDVTRLTQVCGPFAPGRYTVEARVGRGDVVKREVNLTGLESETISLRSPR